MAEVTERKIPNHILGAKLMTALRTSNNKKMETLWSATKRQQLEHKKNQVTNK